MNYVVQSCALRNLKSVVVRSNSFYDLVRCKLFACQRLTIPSLHLKISSINQDSIVDVELSGFFNIKGTSFVVDSFENMMDMLVHGTHSIQRFFCSRWGEFVVVVEAYGAHINGIEASV